MPRPRSFGTVCQCGGRHARYNGLSLAALVGRYWPEARRPTAAQRRALTRYLHLDEVAHLVDLPAGQVPAVVVTVLALEAERVRSGTPSRRRGNVAATTDLSDD